MRIALFTETYLPHVNGVVTHVKSLREGLIQLGHEVLVVTADEHAHRHYLADGVLHCPAHAVKKFYGYGAAKPLSTTRMRYVRRFNPDIIHIHQEFGVGFSGVMIAKMLRVALVYTLHTMYDEYIYYVAPESLVSVTTKLSHQYTKMFAKSAQALTGPSQKCVEYLRKVGVYKPVNIIGNPVDLDAFNPANANLQERARLRERLGIPQDATLGVFVGRLGREKSVDVLLDYWKASITADDHAHLLVIGDGPCHTELISQAARLGIADQITFTGKVLHEEVAPYLSASDFYITASTSDTNSISMLEGMASGLPVLQILDPLNEGQVRDGINGFIFTSADEMAQDIRLLRNMPAPTLGALRDSARHSVEKSGAIDLARYVEATYKQALKNKHRQLRLLELTKRKTMRVMHRGTSHALAYLPGLKLHKKERTKSNEETL